MPIAHVFNGDDLIGKFEYNDVPPGCIKINGQFFVPNGSDSGVSRYIWVAEPHPADKATAVEITNAVRVESDEDNELTLATPPVTQPPAPVTPIEQKEPAKDPAGSNPQTTPPAAQASGSTQNSGVKK